VFIEAKDSRAVARVVTADPFKDPGPVVKTVGQEVNPSLLPINELTVDP